MQKWSLALYLLHTGAMFGVETPRRDKVGLAFIMALPPVCVVTSVVREPSAWESLRFSQTPCFKNTAGI